MESVQSDNKAENVGAPAPNIDHKCTVCRKTYCEPKLLPCGHLMCRKCLLSWLKQTRRATCPYCRYPILKDDEDSQSTPTNGISKEDTPAVGGLGCAHLEDTQRQELQVQNEEDGQSTPSAGISKDDTPTEGEQADVEDEEDEGLHVLVDGFPTDLWMAAYVKAKQRLSEKQKCQGCEEPATSICLQCGDTLCGSCKTIHSNFTMLSHHVVEDLSSLTPERLADVQPPTPCLQHPGERRRLFCPQHDTSLCVDCLGYSHQDCVNVTPFGKHVDQAKETLTKVMTDSAAVMEKSLSELDKHLADMEQHEKTALADIQTLKERLTQAVEDRCEQLEQQTKAAMEDIREAVREAKVVLLGRQSRLVTHTALAQRVLTFRAHDVVCDMTSVVEDRLNDFKHVALPDGSKAITTAKLIVEDVDVLNVEQKLAELGELNVRFIEIAANVYNGFFPNQSTILSNGDRTVTRPTGKEYSVVVVRKPVAIGELIEVHIDLWTETVPQGFIFGGTQLPGLGVTQTPPGKINLHQYSQLEQIPCSSVITRSFYVGNNFSQHLQSVKQGSRMGVLLDHNHGLHLYIDGCDCGVFAQNVKQPCYALFDLSTKTLQATLLPRQKMEM